MARRSKYIFAKEKKSKKVLKGILIVALIAVIGLAIAFVYINFFGIPSKVHVKNPANVEINTEVKASSLIKSVDGGKINKDVTLDTTKLGKNQSTVSILVDDKVRDYTLRYKVIDTQKPEIKCPDQIVVKKGKKADLEKEIKIIDNSGEKIKPEIKGDFDINKEGTYNVKVIAKDSSENQSDKKIVIKVASKEVPTKVHEGDFVTKNGFDAKKVDGVLMIDGHAIINKSYGAPETYNPGPLQDSEMAYAKLVEAANADGIKVFIVNSYRNYANQKTFYDSMVEMLGKKEADRYYGKAGHSDNQTGEAFDLNRIDSSFADTKEGKWLNDNCYKYGFIIRFPKDGEKFTGFAYEPWHIRYVGPETAKKLYNDGKWMSLEEYYGIPSKY